MVSTGKGTGFAGRMRAPLAVFGHDLGGLWQSKLIRLWLAATFVFTLLLTMSNWKVLADAHLIAFLLVPYLVFPWFFVVIVLGVTPVSGARTETLADGILSRPVSRHGYLLATWAARVVMVLGIFFVVTVPAILLITLGKRPVPTDGVTVYGVISSLFIVGLVLTLIVSLGFLAGTVLRRPLLAAVVLIFAWYPVNIVLSVFSLEQFSPISLSQAIPTQLRKPLFKSDDDAEGEINKQDVQAISNFLSDFGNVFSDAKPAEQEDNFFETDKYEDFSLFKVTCGYLAPTVVAVALSLVCFYRRDL